MSDFRLPAEWEPQSAVWMAWPCKEHLWRDTAQKIKHRFSALISIISKHTKVKLVCSAEYKKEAESYIFNGCALLANIEYVNFETDDVWFRDFGPLFTLNKIAELKALNWQFNAWGGKFPFEQDNLIAKQITDTFSLPAENIDYILEGGAIDVNGFGQLLTTESVLLNPKRNAGLSKKDYEELFLKHLGVDQVIWLKNGLIADDTDGHIDNVARFINKNTVLLASCHPHNPNYSDLSRNKEILTSTYINEEKINIIELPLPDPVFHNGQNLPASYLNFLITNNLILVPSYNQPKNDDRALNILKNDFPNHCVEPFNCSDFLIEGGAIHCLTMNLPLSK
jgi:agmatine deiminase